MGDSLLTLTLFIQGVAANAVNVISEKLLQTFPFETSLRTGSRFGWV